MEDFRGISGKSNSEAFMVTQARFNDDLDKDGNIRGGRN